MRHYTTFHISRELELDRTEEGHETNNRKYGKLSSPILEMVGLDICLLLCYSIYTLHSGGTEMSDQDFRERVLESLSRLETQGQENSRRLGTLEHDVGWIKGKLEGKQEGTNKALNVISLCTSVGAMVSGNYCPHNLKNFRNYNENQRRNQEIWSFLDPFCT